MEVEKGIARNTIEVEEYIADRAENRMYTVDTLNT